MKWAFVYGAHISKKTMEAMIKYYGGECLKAKMTKGIKGKQILALLFIIKKLDFVLIDSRLKDDSRIKMIEEFCNICDIRHQYFVDPAYTSRSERK